MRTKIVNYLDVEAVKPVYGIALFINNKWFNLAEFGKPVFCATVAAANEVRSRYRKLTQYEAGWNDDYSGTTTEPKE